MAKKKVAPKKEQVDDRQFIVRNADEEVMVCPADLMATIDRMHPCMIALEETTRRIDVNQAGITMRVLYRGK